MSKRAKRWPIWKITLSAVAWAVLGIVLILLGRYADRVAAEAVAGDTGNAPVMSLPTVMMGLGVAGLVLCVITCIWLGLRIQESRLPPWERAARRKKRR